MRRPFLAGNWKMHKTRAEAVDLARSLQELVGAEVSIVSVGADRANTIFRKGTVLEKLHSEGKYVALGMEDAIPLV